LYIDIKVSDLDKADILELIDNYRDLVVIAPSKLNNSADIILHHAYGNVSSLSYSVSVFCEQYYHGVNCEKFCMPIENHYSCNNNGDKLCSPNWFGDQCLTFCKPENSINNGFYTCGMFGEKICEKSWYGPDCKTYCVNGSTSFCTTNGKKVCLQDWYGKDCSSYCNPSISIGAHFTCDKITGDKVCQQNWYGQDCTTYCKVNDGSHYECNQLTGVKNCFNSYYGKDCSILCNYTQADNFTCNQAGEKVCRKYFHGENCDIYGKL